MVIVLALYFGLVWLVFSKLKLLPWNGASKGIVYAGALVIALVVIGALNHTTPSGRVSVQGAVTPIAPNVAGIVVEVPVAPNTQVEAGAVLFRIDPEPFEIEVARLEAVLQSARATADQLHSDLTAAEAEIEGLEVQLVAGEQRRDDIIQLQDRGASTRFQEQEAVATIDQLQASLRAANARRAGLERRIAAQIDGVDVAVVEAEQALAAARWNLEQTVVRAPSDGVVTALSLRPGNRASPLQGAVNFLTTEAPILIATLPQSSRPRVSIGDEIRIALRTMPGTEISGTISSFPRGFAEGTLDTTRGALPTLAQLAGASTYVVRVEGPTDLPPETLSLGASGTALVITEGAGAISKLAEILFWVSKMLNFI